MVDLPVRKLWVVILPIIVTGPVQALPAQPPMDCVSWMEATGMFYLWQER